MPSRSQKPKPAADRVEFIVSVIARARAKTIKRINTQLAHMSPNDLQALERLIGRRKY